VSKFEYTQVETDRQTNGQTPDRCFTPTVVDAASVIYTTHLQLYTVDCSLDKMKLKPVMASGDACLLSRRLRTCFAHVSVSTLVYVS